MSNDELQKAIDDITSDTAATEEAVATPAVELPEAMGGAAMPASPALAVATEPVVVPAPAAASAAPAPAPVAEAPKAGGDLAEIKKDILVELYPLVGGMNIQPKTKFDICMKVVEQTGEKGAISAALAATKEMADANEKGPALLALMEEIDKL